MTVAIFFRTEALAGVTWAVVGATVQSKLNQPYSIELEIETDQLDVEPLELLGTGAELEIREGQSYGGVISSVKRGHDEQSGWVRATVVVEPALCALRHGRDSRIFQDMSVPEILEQVLSAELAPYGRTAHQALQRSYPTREYLVQYEESHFDFVHRLMEEEGIVYCFEQRGDAEVMVLFDSAAAYSELASGVLLEYSTTGYVTGQHEQEYVREFDPISRVRGSDVAVRRFDWTHPGAPVLSASAPGEADELPHGAVSGPRRESYEHDAPVTLSGFAGAYAANNAADQALVRREAQARDARVFEGWSGVAGARVGSRFDLQGHPNVALNASYAFVSVTHYVNAHARSARGEGASSQEEAYFNRFQVVPAATLYRPERTRPHPSINGIQTAIVTGPAGEEIHTDEHGRVKVQFPWDRLGAGDDHTTRWIRVQQTWSGPNFGAFVLPRVGMEVIVSFVDGDPDRPIVTGCVYNGANGAPYAMPAKKMQSGFKTNSYPGGGGYNELRFDDTQSQEEIYLQGQKDWNTLIKHDLTRDVLNNEVQTVGVDRTRNVGNDEVVEVAKNRTKTVGVDETLNVGVNRVRDVGVTETVTIGAIQNITVGTIQNINVGAAQNESIGGVRTTVVGETDNLTVIKTQNRRIGGDENSKVGLNRSRKVSGNESVKVSKDQSIDVLKNRNRTVGANESVKVSKDQSIDVLKNRNRTVGASESISVSKNQSVDVGASRTRNVAKNETITVGINQAVNVGLARQLSVGGAYAVTVGAAYALTVTGLVTVKAGISHEIVCGDASIKLERDGTITIAGKKVIITGEPITLN